MCTKSDPLEGLVFNIALISEQNLFSDLRFPSDTVDTPDATLIATQDKVHKVKGIVEYLHKNRLHCDFNGTTTTLLDFSNNA
jgi:hypothetical protein